MNRSIECAVYEPEPGDKVRIVLQHANSWRPIFWFELEKDSSIYLGPRYKNITTLRRGSTVVEDGKFRINYADGEDISNSEDLKSAKLSFHGSGALNAPGTIELGGPPLRQLKEQVLLCIVLFQQIDNFESIQSVRKRDVCLHYPLELDCPLCAHLFVATKPKSKIVKFDNVSYQLNLIFKYSNLEAGQDIDFQIVLSHGVQGPWPPKTYLVFKDERT